MDKTLDDIIKQNKQKKPQNFRKQQRPNNNMQQNKFRRAGGNVRAGGVNRNRLGGRKVLSITTSKNTTDARNKIISNKKIKFADARDRLAQIARQGDARQKLNTKKPTELKTAKNRQVNQQKPMQLKNFPIKPRQALKPTQVPIRKPTVVRTVATAQQKPRFLQGKAAAVMRNFQSKPGVVKKFVNNNQQVVSITTKPTQKARLAMQNRISTTHNAPLAMQNRISGASKRNSVSTAPRRTQAVRTRAPIREYREPAIVSRPVVLAEYPEGGMRTQRLRLEPEIIQPVRRVPQYVEAAYYEDVPVYRDSLYDSSFEYQAYPKMSSAPVVETERGTKVVVSNLHPCVSVEDMEELFGTIGNIYSVQMVRQGVAEAMFVNMEDAYRAVDLFNNRQLDGQPMKVMVVRKKTPMVSSQPLQSRSILKSARGGSAYYI